MSFVGIRIPHEVGRLFSHIPVPGEKVPTDEMHVTLLYIGKATPLEMIGRAVVAAAEVAEAVRPFRLQVSKSTCFPKNDDGVPIICPVESPDLHELNSQLKAAFDKHNVDYSKKFPDYKPHVTLSYASDLIQEESFAEPLEWSAYEMVLWAGDSGDDRVSATFPFAFPKKIATDEKLVRLMAAVRH